MESYNQYIKKCHKKRLPDIIEHSSLAHGRLIVKHLIELATEQKLPIHMISGALYEEFWNPLIDPLKKYLEDGKASLKLIIINSDKAKSENNSAYRLLNNPGFSSKIVIHKGIDQNIVASQPHFFLVGKEAYRKEESQNRAVAIASFNDHINGKRLLKTFKFITSIIEHESTTTSNQSSSYESIKAKHSVETCC